MNSKAIIISIIILISIIGCKKDNDGQSLNGTWESNTNIIEVNNTNARFVDFISGNWLRAYNNGIISKGDLRLKNIVIQPDGTWDCEILFNYTDNSTGEVVSVGWNYSYIKMDSDNRITIYANGLSTTYYRD